MVGYFDTSLLFNVYIPQATGTASALGVTRKAPPVVLTALGLHRVEKCNVLGGILGGQTRGWGGY